SSCWIVSILTFLSLQPIANAGFSPVLSEIMAVNDSLLADEDGDFSDWIEIQNTGDMAGDLAAWSLSDDSGDLVQWTFPSTPMAPGEFLVVFASKKNRAVTGSELHANFKLSSGGEFLSLTMPDGTTKASSFDPTFPQQFPDVSWGSAGYFTTATPGNTNSPAGSAPIAAVIFNPGSQIFTTSLTITLSNPTAGTTLIYTTDGTDPNAANGTSYTAAFAISATTEIRARAQISDADAGSITTRKYLKLATDTQTFSSPLPIVVLDNFGAGSVPQRNSSTGPNGNDGSGVIQVARQPVLMAIFDRTTSGQASPADPPTIVSNAGIRVRGSSSASLSKKPLSLETWEDGTIEQSADISPFGMPAESDWVLYAPTEAFSGNRYDRPLLHNSFIYQLSNEIGRYATRTQFVEVFLNTGGGSLSMSDYAGIYIFIEQRKRGNDRIDFERLSQDGSDGGWMINADRMDPQPIGGGTPRHFHTPGPNQTLETPNDSAFGVRNRDDLPEFYHSFFNFESPGGYEINAAQRNVIESEMNAFEDALYGASWKDLSVGYAAHIDVDNFIDQYILQNLTKNQDAYVLSTLLYRDTAPDKIKFGPIWDFDRGYTTSPTSTNPSSNLRFADNRMWFPRLFDDVDFEQKYIDRWQELRAGSFATDHMNAIIDAQKAEITEPVALRNGTSSWPAKVEAMKNWLTTRTAAIDAQFVPRPSLSIGSGSVAPSTELTLLAAAGSDIYYTSNGSDPRLPGGGISPNAILFNGGAANTVDTTVVPFGTDCRYFVAEDDTIGFTWTAAPSSFDDSTWTLAPPGLGWENTPPGLAAGVNTDIKDDMVNKNASGYFRWNFDFFNAASLNSITLRVTIDDGFAAFLNGTRIGGFNAPTPLQWNSSSTGSRSDQTVLSTVLVIDASAFKSAVLNGGNALAIQGMNTLAGGSDFLIDASLELSHTSVDSPLTLDQSVMITARALDGNEWSGPVTATYAVGSTPAEPSNLVVSEIMYNPSPPTQAEINAGILDGDQFEYIELMNIGSSEIDLTGASFTDGIDFTFPPGLDSLLPAGKHIVVAKNLAALDLRHGVDPSRRIGGTFENDTNLRDGGETIALVNIDGITIRNFTYDDDAPWPIAADGAGYSLVLELPATNPSHSLATSWHSSAIAGGSPGGSGTVKFLGDPLADADGDSLNRLIEFATGSDDDHPSVSPIELIPTGSGTIALTYRRNLAAAGITYRIETSTDLSSWTETPGSASEQNLGDGTALIRVTPTPATGDRCRYFRLGVELVE
ncbi:MAG: hypothetical protein ACI9UA_003475, partial [Pseudoalteromonas tetraodonis]